ncbi:unnamed protein product [Prunus armeniaca]|uniref:Uncharacterized protein n=1 Tax=Prunus armeniaca TaxID=36596 RepID=A0A6J5XEE8_PRUAR|nr:unnamed protein product [Prunus armeniaca]
MRARSSNKKRARVIKEINLYGKKSNLGRQISNICRFGVEESVGGVNVVQPPVSRGVMGEAWLSKADSIRSFSSHLLSMVDEDMADQIINEGPWSVMRFCFNVQRWPSNMAIEELPLHKVAYWIQAHGIPLNLLTARNALEIGEKLGKVKEVENPWEKGSRGFLHMRVMIDSNNPLPQRFWLPRAEG